VADDAQDRKNAALQELSAADRAYRAAFRQLTSAGGSSSPSSFALLLEAVERLEEAVRQLEAIEGQETQ